MDQIAHLWLFFLIVLGVVVLPGLDMACVLASALTGGSRDGLAAVAGIVGGGVCHVVVGTLGIATVLALAPAAFNALLLAGAAYIAWVGFSLMRAGWSPGPDAPSGQRGLAAFRRGALTNLLNPKAYLFMLAIFPQFLRPDQGPVWRQALALGLIIAAVQAGVYGGIAVAAGQVRGWLGGKPAVMATLFRGVGLLLVAAAAYTGVEGWRGL